MDLDDSLVGPWGSECSTVGKQHSVSPTLFYVDGPVAWLTVAACYHYLFRMLFISITYSCALSNVVADMLNG